MRRDLSPGERDQLRLCRKVVWAAPLATAVLVASVVNTADVYGYADDLWLQVLVWATIAAGIAVAAYAVVRLHPIDRYKFWRAALACVFAATVGMFVADLLVTVVWMLRHGG